VAALLECATLAEAAVQARVSEPTLHRWLKEAEFLEAYREARRQVVEAAVGRVQQLTAQATATLRRNLDCGNGSVEVRAALGVLQHATKGVEVYDLAVQLARLQEQLAEVMTRGQHNGFAASPGRPLNGAAPPGGSGRPSP
jgi:hypothetical protein